jgi:dihydrofolate synthase/folylpolyglutamate synthase
LMQRTLDDWLAHAERLHPVGIDMGLERVRSVAERLDVLPPAPRSAVIAGTNGKGSTAVYLEALLRGCGRTVGTTLSPHLHCFNERVRIDGTPVADNALCDAFAAIETARRDTTLTYFEFGVLAALYVFRQARVDDCVLEVGLGGRLDAINIVDGAVTVISSVGIDHVNYLGPDRESIGAEKAGIMRDGVPCVYGEASVPASVRRAAERVRAPLVCYGTDFAAYGGVDGWQFEGTTATGRIVVDALTMPRVALANAATALQALLLLEPDAPVTRLVRGAAEECLPGRFERFQHRGVTVIVDVAHNPHGAAFLAAQLAATEVPGRTFAIAGFLQDKDVAGIVASLDAVVDEWVFVNTEGPRGQPATSAAERMAATTHAMAGGDLSEALEMLTARSSERDRIVVLGCFDVAQRARRALRGEVTGGR